MTDENALRRDTGRAAHAQRLMDDELLQEAFAALEAAYIAEWRITAVRDDHARERLWIAVNVLGKVKEHLARAVSGGKIAQRQLDDLEARSRVEQLRRRFGA